MKALLLNSGVGSRMGALTADRPKCLVEISDGVTILGRQLSMLESRGIGEIVITTGPYADLVKNHVRSLYPALEVTFVQNPKFETTNYIYSMHLARSLLHDDILLLHGDIVTEQPVLAMLLSGKEENAVIVSKPAVLPEKDFKARIVDGCVTEIDVSLAGSDLAFLLPFYRFSEKAMSVWLSEIARFVERGTTGVYAEEAFNRISTDIRLAPIRISESDLCMEVDNADDLGLARKLVSGRGA